MVDKAVSIDNRQLIYFKYNVKKICNYIQYK